jgi:hypothetical protein
MTRPKRAKRRRVYPAPKIVDPPAPATAPEAPEPARPTRWLPLAA